MFPGRWICSGTIQSTICPRPGSGLLATRSDTLLDLFRRGTDLHPLELLTYFGQPLSHGRTVSDHPSKPLQSLTMCREQRHDLITPKRIARRLFLSCGNLDTLVGRIYSQEHDTLDPKSRSPVSRGP